MMALLPLIIQLVSGAVGGNVAGAVLKNLPVGKVLATILGAVGGAGFGQLADYLPMLEGLMNGGGMGAEAGAGAGGGALLTTIIGFIKKALESGGATGPGGGIPQD